MSKNSDKQTTAAGCVVLRPGPGDEPEVLLVHRPRYDDWSLPKGKIRADESLPGCAARETTEETGVAVRLAGAEGRFPSIPAPSLRQVATASVTGRGSPWVELRQEALRADADPKLRAGIEVALARHQARRAWRNRPWSR